jgi:hypothetical protein
MVKTLRNESAASGTHRIVWNGRHTGGDRAEAGVYFYELELGDKRTAGKLILLD